MLSFLKMNASYVVFCLVYCKRYKNARFIYVLSLSHQNFTIYSSCKKSILYMLQLIHTFLFEFLSLLKQEDTKKKLSIKIYISI